MREMRKGVVLFITLSIIAAMLAMVGVIFTYLEKSKSNASYTAAMIQADLLFSDSKNTISALLKKEAKNKEAKKAIFDILYLAPVTLQAAENEEIFTTLTCRPLDAGININWLGLENNSSAQHLYESAQSVFDRLAEIYNIQNASHLLSKIMRAVNGKEDSADRSQGRLEQKKGIINLLQIQRIARDYRFEEDDPSVEEIAWEKYFSFDPGSTLIDGSYLSAELLAFYFDMELDFVKEEWIEGDDLKQFITVNGGDLAQYKSELFAKEAIERMRCRVSYGYQGKVYAFGFDYLEERAEKFEFFGEQ